ncbi:hypothetical protein BGZ46_000075 [Entomortierella lignicola]|nr:hypothetical protein BGZ46_000075 [Entomortierella lignicola]
MCHIVFELALHRQSDFLVEKSNCTRFRSGSISQKRYRSNSITTIIAFPNSSIDLYSATTLTTPVVRIPRCMRLIAATGDYPNLAKNDRIFSNPKFNPIRSRMLQYLKDYQEIQQLQLQQGQQGLKRIQQDLCISPLSISIDGDIESEMYLNRELRKVTGSTIVEPREINRLLQTQHPNSPPTIAHKPEITQHNPSPHVPTLKKAFPPYFSSAFSYPYPSSSLSTSSTSSSTHLAPIAPYSKISSESSRDVLQTVLPEQQHEHGVTSTLTKDTNNDIYDMLDEEEHLDPSKTLGPLKNLDFWKRAKNRKNGFERRKSQEDDSTVGIDCTTPVILERRLSHKPHFPINGGTGLFPEIHIDSNGLKGRRMSVQELGSPKEFIVADDLPKNSVFHIPIPNLKEHDYDRHAYESLGRLMSTESDTEDEWYLERPHLPTITSTIRPSPATKAQQYTQLLVKLSKVSAKSHHFYWTPPDCDLNMNGVELANADSGDFNTWKGAWAGYNETQSIASAANATVGPRKTFPCVELLRRVSLTDRKRTDSGYTSSSTNSLTSPVSYDEAETQSNIKDDIEILKPAPTTVETTKPTSTFDILSFAKSYNNSSVPSATTHEQDSKVECRVPSITSSDTQDLISEARLSTMSSSPTLRPNSSSIPPSSWSSSTSGAFGTPHSSPVSQPSAGVVVGPSDKNSGDNSNVVATCDSCLRKFRLDDKAPETDGAREIVKSALLARKKLGKWYSRVKVFFGSSKEKSIEEETRKLKKYRQKIKSLNEKMDLTMEEMIRLQEKHQHKMKALSERMDDLSKSQEQPSSK